MVYEINFGPRFNKKKNLFYYFSGLAVGIYATNSPEACHYVAENCDANILVVENDQQLKKILQVSGKFQYESLES